MATKINAKHSFPEVTKVDTDEFYRLALVPYFIKGVHVMSIRGLWANNGPSNGSFDVVQYIIYFPGHYPQQLPLAILAEFKCFTRLNFFERNYVVLIRPLTADIFIDGQNSERQ